MDEKRIDSENAVENAVGGETVEVESDETVKEVAAKEEAEGFVFESGEAKSGEASDETGGGGDGNADDGADDGDADADIDANASEPKKQKKRKSKKLFIILGVVVVVLIGAGAGVWVWHDEPSFCNAICHTPMDPYYRTFNYATGQAAQDKWENEIPNASAMLAVTHRENGIDCLDCHVPTLGEQITEAISWITSNYKYPLSERRLKDLTAARDLTADEFCLNESCHHVSSHDGSPITSRADLKAVTSDLARNVHIGQHGAVECGECHKAHRASTISCTSCHLGDTKVPEGWIIYTEAQKLRSNALAAQNN